MTSTAESGVLSLVVTMTIKPEQEAAFLKMATEFIAWVHANEDGILLYELTRNSDLEHTFTWLERYRDEAAAKAHGSTPQIAAARAQLADMHAKPPVRMVLHQLTPA
jgi:quinol monooxygenase YgiN